MAGMRNQSNNYTLDGISNNDPHVNGPLNLFRLSDAVQEFNVSTSIAGAEVVVRVGHYHIAASQDGYGLTEMCAAGGVRVDEAELRQGPGRRVDDQVLGIEQQPARLAGRGAGVRRAAVVQGARP